MQLLWLCFPRKVRLIGKAPINLPKQRVAMGADHKVLLEVDDNSSLIVGDPSRILGQPFRPHPIHLFIIINIMVK